jgi:thioredoxin-related protein
VKTCGITLLVIFLAYVLIHFKQREGFEGRKELLLLHMEGCPHCVKLMPEWKKFISMNNTSIIPKAVEKDEDSSLVKKYNVTGFPTILLLDKNGIKLETYEGPRTAEGLLDFCKQNN